MNIGIIGINLKGICKMKTVVEKLENLRNKMKANNVQAYIICTEDYHGSEYAGDYFKEREYMSGFTGSAGTLVILYDEAALWTDGRYFLQAEDELSGSTIKLMKMFQTGVPAIEEYLYDKLSDSDRIGFDGRTLTTAFAEKIYNKVSSKNITFKYDIDLVGEFWKDRPMLSKEKVWKLDEKYTGLHSSQKFINVRAKMSENGIDTLIVSALDQIAWLLNLRGNDVLCNPVFLSYMMIFRDRAVLYAANEIFDDGILSYLKELNVEVRDYDIFYDELKKIDKNSKIQLDYANSNYCTKMCIPADAFVLNKKSPIILMKAVKTKCEYENEKAAHIKDGAAVTKFMYWLQKNVGKEKITEISAAEKLEQFRCEQDGYLGASFTPIMAFAEHGAIVHYSATEKSNAVLEPRSFLLSDTGGHYIEGTTDITRTFPLGKLTEEEKKAYTVVLTAHLRLAAARFPYGMTGTQLDAIARDPLWQHGMDFNHGTGHGVGYILNVHEGPNGISWQMRNKKLPYAVFEEGMITSNEPGFYQEGRFGIRHENLILCLKDKKTPYGQFMRFENLTFVPFDWDAIDVRYMTESDVCRLNRYHKAVYEKISPFLSEDEKIWLEEKTRERLK